MNLVAETKAVIGWLRTVIGAFMAIRPWTTLSLIQAITIKNFANLLASFLPLKVILLAGSDGVPRYFRFFIPEGADKIPWIIGLTAAAVAFFILGLVMEAIARRLAAAGSFEVLRGANELAVSSQHREEIGGYFSQFSEVAASVLVLAISLTLLAIVNLPVFFALLGLMLIEYMVTVGILAFGNPYDPGRVLQTLKDKPRNYLAFFSSINFLACFFVLLTPFLTGVGGNLILAILAILLMGQANGAVNGIIRPSLKLWRKRPGIDPLVFREQQSGSAEHPTLRDLRQVFDPQERVTLPVRQLALAGEKGRQLESEWLDPGVRGVYRFHLKLHRDEGDEDIRHFQQQAFAPRQLALLEHEEFLFEKLKRSAVRAPAVLARYPDGPFECQICEYGIGRALTADEFKPLASSLLGELWALSLPEDLQRAYRTSHPALEARLAPEFLERLAVSLDNAADTKTFEAFVDALPRIQDRLGVVPLYLHNPDLSASGLTLTEDGSPLVMSWIRWSLKPMGTYLPAEGDERSEELLAEACKARQIEPADLSVDHLKLVHQCNHLVSAIDREHFRAALRCIDKVLDNPLIDNSMGP